MEDKKTVLLKCRLRVFIAYSAISFFWVAFVANGMENSNQGISVFADQLIFSNVAIMGYSLVYGFSMLLFRMKKGSTPAKYSLHMLVNYIGSMVCVYALFSNLKEDPNVTATTWMAVLLIATVAFFVIYGIVSLAIYLVKKKLA